MTTDHEWMNVEVLASLSGVPTLAVPAGFNSGGLPAGLHITGHFGMDKNILRIRQAYHLATDWPYRRPPELTL